MTVLGSLRFLLFIGIVTIKTINFAKQLCKTEDGVMVGGVMASILADRVEKATGIKPHVGTLDTPGELDPTMIWLLILCHWIILFWKK